MIKKLKQKKHIIFDFDQTICNLLIDWNPWIDDMRMLFRDLEKDFDFDGVHYAESQNDFMRKYGNDLRQKIIEINFKDEKEFFNGGKAIEHIVALIPRLAKFAKLYIWSSNDRKTIMPILKDLVIETYFKKIITRNDVEYIKPEADGFYKIFEDKYPKIDYILIGDSRVDEEAAKKAGIDYIHFKKLYNYKVC